MAINKREIFLEMMGAARGVLSDEWPQIKQVAHAELRALAEGVRTIERLRLAGTITQKQAKQLFRMKRNTAKIVLMSLEGLSRVAVERALRAAIKVVRDSVNTSLGFALL